MRKKENSRFNFSKWIFLCFYKQIIFSICTALGIKTQSQMNIDGPRVVPTIFM